MELNFSKDQEILSQAGESCPASPFKITMHTTIAMRTKKKGLYMTYFYVRASGKLHYTHIPRLNYLSCNSENNLAITIQHAFDTDDIEKCRDVYTNNQALSEIRSRDPIKEAVAV